MFDALRVKTASELDMGNCRWRGGVVGLAGYFISFSSSFAQGILYAPDHQPSAWNINQKPAVWDINLAIGAAMVPTFHGSDRYRATPIPLVIIRWRDTITLGDDGLNLYWHNSKLRNRRGCKLRRGTSRP